MSGSTVDISAFEKAMATFGAELRGRVEGLIGFNADYAIFVHEILTSHHPVGQAKFLETALRRAAGDRTLQKAIAFRLQNVKTAGQFLQAVIDGVRDAEIQIIGNAQQLTPVDTGFLQASGTWREPQVVTS